MTKLFILSQTKDAMQRRFSSLIMSTMIMRQGLITWVLRYVKSWVLKWAFPEKNLKPPRPVPGGSSYIDWKSRESTSKKMISSTGGMGYNTGPCREPGLSNFRTLKENFFQKRKKRFYTDS